jgi:hypothetical protein
MARPPSDAEQIALRVPKSWLAEADELAQLISRPGFEASRTDAFRAATAKGFEVLFEELRPRTGQAPSAWTNACLEFGARMNDKHKKEVGLFSCTLTPRDKIVAIDDYDVLQQLVLSSQVHRGPIRFPQSEHGKIYNRRGFLEGINEVSGYEHYWRAFTGGHFTYVAIRPEEVVSLGARLPEGSYLSLDRACERVALAFMFADRLFEQRKYEGELELEFRWTGTSGRKLVLPSPDQFPPERYECHDSEISESASLTTSELKNEWEKSALSVLVRVCQLFQVQPKPTEAISNKLQRVRIGVP